MDNTLDVRRRIDEICNQFEEAWSAEHTPDFARWLKLIDESNRGRLLRSLLEVEIELRLRATQAPSPAQYEHFGPEVVAWVIELLEANHLKRIGSVGETVAHKDTTSTGGDPIDRIGRYSLVQKLGEGGMGSVWLAEQTTPVRRRVALKVIKPGMDSSQIVARFEAERQALAMMDHQNIARVLDAGMTDDGRPYFVMELVQGIPFTQYCDQNKLSIEERLALFIPVCHAVQHAHQKGIIHRDLKPSNVLVCLYDGKPVPKVIDFGLAKALQHTTHLTDKTLFTEFGQVVGTLQYMSPEQAEMDQLDIDTRTDVYSLGVMLYELLTGTTPIDREMLHNQAILKVLEVIREKEPLRPSARLSSASHDIASEISQHRRIDSSKLKGILTGELDWVVMKAIDKDRSRRYETANGLAVEIQRFLDDEPVIARPPSTSYRLRKFVKKNLALVASVATIFALLVVGVAGTSSGMAWALSERTKARIAQQQSDTNARRAKEAEKTATDRANELQLVSDFQAEILTGINPTDAGIRLMQSIRTKLGAALSKARVSESDRKLREEAFSRELFMVNATDTAAEMIDRTILQPAVAAVDSQFKNQAKVDAQLRQVLAGLYKDLGLYAAAMPLQQSAVDIRRRILGDECEESLDSINNMGVLLQALGKLDEAEPYIKEAFEKCPRILGDEHELTLNSIDQMGSFLQAQGKLAEAEPYLLEALEKKRRVLGEEHPITLTCMNNVGGLFHAQGKMADAESYWLEALEKRRRVLGDDHPDTQSSINNLGGLLQSQGRLAEAEPYIREALELSRKLLGEDHPYTLTSINNLGGLLRQQGKLKEVEPFWREVLEKSRRSLGDEHPQTTIYLHNLGSLLRDLEKLDEAEPYIREALEKMRRLNGENHPNTLAALNSLAALLHAQGDLEEAEALFRELLQKCVRVMGPGHRNTLLSTINMAKLLIDQKKYPEAIELLAPIGDLARKAFTGANARAMAQFLKTLGIARAQTNEFRLAEDNLLEAHPLFVTSGGAEHKETRECQRALVELYDAWHAAEPANGYDVKANKWKAMLDEQDQAPLDRDDDDRRINIRASL